MEGDRATYADTATYADEGWLLFETLGNSVRAFSEETRETAEGRVRGRTSIHLSLKEAKAIRRSLDREIKRLAQQRELPF